MARDGSVLASTAGGSTGSALVSEVYLHLVASTIERYSFRSTAEADIQEALESVLRSHRIHFVREVALDSHSRIDFLTREGLGVEVKVKGSRPALLRQLHRYAQSARVGALLVVTTRAKLLELPDAIGGKTLEVASLLAGGL